VQLRLAGGGGNSSDHSGLPGMGAQDK